MKSVTVSICFTLPLLSPIHALLHHVLLCVSLFSWMLPPVLMISMSLFLLCIQKLFCYTYVGIFAVSSSFISYIFSPDFFSFTWPLEISSLILDKGSCLASLLTEKVGLRSLLLAEAGARAFLSGIFSPFPDLSVFLEVLLLLISSWCPSGWQHCLVPDLYWWQCCKKPVVSHFLTAHLSDKPDSLLDDLEDTEHVQTGYKEKLAHPEDSRAMKQGPREALGSQISVVFKIQL